MAFAQDQFSQIHKTSHFGAQESAPVSATDVPELADLVRHKATLEYQNSKIKDLKLLIEHLAIGQKSSISDQRIAIFQKQLNDMSEARDQTLNAIGSILNAVRKNPDLASRIKRVGERIAIQPTMMMGDEMGDFLSDLTSAIKNAGAKGLDAMKSSTITSLATTTLANPVVQASLADSAKRATTFAATQMAAKGIEAVTGFVGSKIGKYVLIGTGILVVGGLTYWIVRRKTQHS